MEAHRPRLIARILEFHSGDNSETADAISASNVNVTSSSMFVHSFTNISIRSLISALRSILIENDDGSRIARIHRRCGIA